MIADLLDELANLQAKLDVIQLYQDQAIKANIPEEWLIRIDDIRFEHEKLAAVTKTTIAELDARIREMVLVSEESVQGKHLVATYNKARVRWNDDALCGIAIDHPEILAFRVVGEPSVTIKQRQQRKG